MKFSIFQRIESVGLTRSTILRAALVCLLPLVGAATGSAQAAVLTINAGSILPIYLPPAALDEAFPATQGLR